eukprot:2384727-Pyramimonas_sp.AAC.1
MYVYELFPADILIPRFRLQIEIRQIGLEASYAVVDCTWLCVRLPSPPAQHVRARETAGVGTATGLRLRSAPGARDRVAGRSYLMSSSKHGNYY